ncbi:MAG TPA: hypothetical protein VMB84_11245 [Stellaceae bacterium]|nr:hypothetical protein [Stellaceae bacterium]
MRGAALAICLAATILGRSARADGVADAWAGTAWGESPQALQRALGSRGFALPQPIDFGDSYAPLVVRQLPVGGFPLIVYYQIDKASHGLKRIQLELPRHRVNAAAFRGVYDALAGALGIPDTACGAAPGAATGYQGTAEYAWRRDGLVIRAIFRDTSLEALGGCVSPACGLTAQLLVRVSPPALDGGTCAKLPTRGELRARP